MRDKKQLRLKYNREEILEHFIKELEQSTECMKEYIDYATANIYEDSDYKEVAPDMINRELSILHEIINRYISKWTELSTLLFHQTIALNKSVVQTAFQLRYPHREQPLYTVFKEQASDKRDKTDNVEPAKNEAKNGFQKVITALRKQQEEISHQTHSLQFIEQLSSDISQQRIFPVSIYLAENDGVPDVIHAVKNFIVLMDGEIIEAYEPVIASYFERLWAKWNTPKNKAELIKCATTLKKATEIQAIDLPRSEEIMRYANTVATLAASLNEQSAAVIQIHNFMFVKRTINGSSQIISRVLSDEEMDYIQRNQDLLHKPEKALEALDTMVDRIKADRMRLSNP